MTADTNDQNAYRAIEEVIHEIEPYIEILIVCLFICRGCNAHIFLISTVEIG